MKLGTPPLLSNSLKWVILSGKVLVMKFQLKPKLFLTYDNSLVLDGVGAQIQRIVSIYGVSRLVKVGYLHAPIIDFDPQIFSDSTYAERLPDIEKWNSLFRYDLPRYVQANGDFIFHTNKIGIRRLEILNFLSRFSRSRIICKMGNPRKITDEFPNILNSASELMSKPIDKINSVNGSNDFKIVVHIRQGVLALSQFKNRLIPLSHYENVLGTVTKILKTFGIQYQILIPQETGQSTRLSIENSQVIQSMALDPDNAQVRVNNDGTVTLIHESLDLIVTPILCKTWWLEPASAFSDFELMLNADLLIISKSSFSFLAGLINQKAIKIFAPFWHSTPDDWFNAEDIDLDRLIDKIVELSSSKT